MLKELRLIIILLSISFAIKAQEITSVPDSALNVNDTLAVTENEVDTIPLTLRLDSLLSSSMFKTSQVSLYVYDLDGDSIIYEHNKAQLMRPASVEKLLTSITALDCLGSSYQFRTNMYGDGTIVEDSIYQGNIYFKGGMDPAFCHDDMYAMVGVLQKEGIKKIDGLFFCDLSFKDSLHYGEGWCWDDDNYVLTPLLYESKDIFMEQFFEMLSDCGISHTKQYKGYVIESTDSLELLSTRTHNMDQILMPMLKNSNNLYAESMMYQLGAGKVYAPASESIAKIRQQINKIGMGHVESNIADGSGLSLYNYTTSELIVKFLQYSYQRNNIFLHLYPSLPIAGTDGTLSHRMVNTIADGNVHAKTGTLSRVSTLAGYLKRPDGNMVAFCIMNQGIRSQSKAHTFQDRVCKLLCKYPFAKNKSN